MFGNLIFSWRPLEASLPRLEQLSISHLVHKLGILMLSLLPLCVCSKLQFDSLVIMIIVE